jgi:hypothetical protein
MAKCSSLASVLALAFIASLAVGIAPGVRAAGDRGTGTQLSLSSGYGGYRLLGGKAHSVHLSVTLDGKGGGKGTLSLDPNSKVFDPFGVMIGSTEIAVWDVPVTLEEVKVKDQPRGGPRSYEIQGHGLAKRLFLVLPAGGTATYRLVSADRNGSAGEVLLLEAEAPPGK